MCHALTNRGTRCRTKADCFCAAHHAQCAIPLYPVIEYWPTTCVVHRNVEKYDNLDDLRKQVNRMKRFVVRGVEYNNFPPDTRTPREMYYARMAFITVSELLKLNSDLCDNRFAQELVDVVASKLDTVPELAAYTEDFRRKCSKSHREAARKRVHAFYFTRCEDLCDDVIEKVLEYV